MRTSELEGKVLDYWVARAEGYEWAGDVAPERAKGVPPYSTNWALGGPIIEREQIMLDPMTRCREESDWMAQIWSPYQTQRGSTPLIAAMRAYVSSKFGDAVPEDINAWAARCSTQQHSTT